MIYSFDVFDTVITRKTATPQGIFAVMQKKLQSSEWNNLESTVRDNFYQLRIGAEEIARDTICKNGIQDVNLPEIYQVLVNADRISNDVAEKLIELEINTELENVIGISENIERIKVLHEQGKRVLLISDMYLDQTDIQMMLVKADSIFEEIPLYVSSNIRKNKWHNSLYRYVAEKEAITFDEWIHCGDNKYSDVEVPKRLGIHAECYETEELLPIEQQYLKYRKTNVEAQLAIGCARYARICGKKTNAFCIGSSIGGQLIYPYVNWVISDCLNKGIRRLYFVARDGFIVKELADVIIEQRNLPIKTKYIYGSRIAWRIPDSDNLKQDIKRIYEHSYQDRILTLKDFADFWGCSQEELKKYVPSKIYESQKTLTVPVVNRLVDRMLQNEDFFIFIADRYDKRRERLELYLKQEIDTKDDAFAFVDVAGSGLTMESLYNTMRRFYTKPIDVYYYRQDISLVGNCRNHVFCPIKLQNNIMLEMLCRAPHGQTVGYERDNNIICPIFVEVDSKEIIDHGVLEFIEGAKLYTKTFEKYYLAHRNSTNSTEIIREYFDYICNSPDEEVLAFFADMPNMLTGREKKFTVYAPKLSKQDLKNIYFYKDDNEALEKYYDGSSFAYSLKRCTLEEQQKIEKYKTLRNTWYGKLLKVFYKKCQMSEKQKNTDIYDLLEDRIIIYGAGKKGQLFYNRATGRLAVNGKKNNLQVVLWVDKNYKKCQDNGLPVVSPMQILEADYDQLVIAVLKKDIAEEIKTQLIQSGVPEKKIIWDKELLH